MGQSGQSAGWLFHAGQQVDHFRVMRPLGRGGMADVYLARDTKLGRKVALKVIQADALGSQDALERFLFEARATARFNHPHIVTIYFVGEHGGQPYLALEYLEGQTLRQRLDQERPGVQETLRIALAVADALQAAHAEQIIHRDLKPDNVWLARDGRLRVLDFGLARVVAGDAPTGDSAPSGEAAALPHREQASTLEAGFLSRGTGLRGTPAYMAPEQWQEQPTTGATDVWALGVMLHELLCGHRPYRERTVFKLGLQICSDAAAPALSGDDLPEALPALVARCLRKAPAGRPSAAEVADQLRQLLARDQRLSPDASPFRGLLPFDERHSALFFGRDAEVATFVERLRTEPVLPVVGPSGVGKSSFVRAGVIPRLRERGPLELIELRPGASPFAALADRLAAAELPSSRQSSPFGAAVTPRDGEQSRERAGGGARQDPQQIAQQLRATPRQLNLLLQRLAERRGSSVLLFVDQLEELDTLVADEAERIAFMQAICTAADDPLSPVRVVLTLREEFISRVAAGPGVQQALSQITVLRSPSPEALEQTLLRPVEAAGYRYDDPELVPQMVAEVRGEASCLPLLQFAGQLLWERRDVAGRLLRRSVHEEMGGVAGALARHADGVLAGLSANEVQLARAILLRMTTSEGARRVLPRSAVLDGLDPAAGRVLGRLIDARLLTVRQAEQEGDALLELVHESLVLNWSRLRRWIEESREELVLLEEIGQAAALWDKRGRPDQEVWHGEALQNAQRAVEHCTTRVPGQVRQFLAAGRVRQLRQQRRRRIGLGAALCALALIAAVSVLVALSFSRQKRRAEQGQAEAEQERAEAQREAARGAMVRGDLLEARARLRLSLETDDSLRSRALWRQLSVKPVSWRKKIERGIWNVEFSPDGRTLAVAAGSAVLLIDIQTREVLRAFANETGMWFSAAFSPDGRLLALNTGHGVLVWKTNTGKLHRKLEAPGRAAFALAFSPDSHMLASTHGSQIKLWEVASGKQRHALKGHEAHVWSVKFSPDGSELASGSLDGTVGIWDVRTGKLKRRLRKHGTRVYEVAYSPDGRTLASVGYDGRLRLWDAKNGAQRRELSLGSSTRYNHVSFSPDGQKIAVGDAAGTVWLLDAQTGDVLRKLIGRPALWSLRFSPDSRWLAATFMYDRSVVLWDLSSPWAAHPPAPHTELVMALRFSPDGRNVASASADSTIRLWDARSGAQLAVLRGHTAGLLAIDLSPDNRLIASGSSDASARLWDVRSRTSAGVLSTHASQVSGVRFSPDGRQLATASSDGMIRLWRVADRALLREIRSGAAYSGVGGGHLRYSPDSRLLAMGADDGGIRLWDARTGALRHELIAHQGEAYAIAFSPDNRTLASSGIDRTIRLWDLATGTSRVFWTGDQASAARQLVFHPDGKRLAGATSHGAVHIWDLATGRSRPLEFATPLGGSIAALDLSRDGQLVATGNAFGSVQVVEVGSHRPIWRAPLLLRDPPRLCSHHGWVDLATGKKLGGPLAGWQRAVEQRAVHAAIDHQEQLLCIKGVGEQLELWDIPSDQRVFQRKVPGLARGVVYSTSQGCVVGVEGRVERHRDASAPHVLVASGNSGVDVDGDLILTSTADGKTARVFFPVGKPATYRLRGEANAMMRWKDHLIVAYVDRGFERIHLRTRKRTAFSLEDLPAVIVQTMAVGPRDTLVLGFASGEVGIWDLKTGLRVDQAHLHGEVLHLLIEDNTLYAATDIGSTLVWDLSALSLERCALLREVWKKVPVVWEDGKAVLRPPPPGHPCAPSRR